MDLAGPGIRNLVEPVGLEGRSLVGGILEERSLVEGSAAYFAGAVVLEIYSVQKSMKVAETFY